MHGRILYLVFHKAVFEDPPCLTSFYTTYFWKMRIISLTMYMMQYTRSNRESYQYDWEVLYLVCQQSNKSEPWQMSHTIKYTEGSKHSNRQCDHKTFLVKKKLLEITLDNKRKFYKCNENFYQKGSRQLNALAKLTNYTKLPKRRILMTAFLKAQSKYCPVIWIFHTRSLINKVNRLH